jgi:hypothetical protein
MTEAEWLASNDPEAMLKFLRGRASDRKYQSFALAYCRRFFHLLVDDRSRRALEVFERFIEGAATDGQRVYWMKRAHTATQELRGRVADLHYEAACGVLVGLSRLAPGEPYCTPVFRSLQEVEGGYASPIALVRDVFGNPFRPAALAPAWLTSTVVALASQMYESREFGAMPILADALQDAGCTNDDVLTHCRDPKQVHVRGCWVVDLVLGGKV